MINATQKKSKKTEDNAEEDKNTYKFDIDLTNVKKNI